MTDFWTTVFDFTQATTAKVGAKLLQFGQVQAEQKTDGSLVTQADKWADREIQEAIAATFPSHGIISEESGHIFPGTEWCWVIDPLDGTTNFTHQLPIWAISVGLLYQGTPVFGYVHLPPLSQTFHGYWYGDTGLSGPNGAFLNHHPIHTSIDSPSQNQFFSLCSRSLSILGSDFPCKTRMLGATSYNFLTVAAGTTLGGVEATPKIWDIAAVWAIVHAAGGVWVSLHPEPVFPLVKGMFYGDRSYPTLVVAQPEVVPVFQPLMQSIRSS